MSENLINNPENIIVEPIVLNDPVVENNSKLKRKKKVKPYSPEGIGETKKDDSSIINNKSTLRSSQGYYANINYPKNEFGRINWKEMIPKEYLVVNKEYFDRVGKPYPAEAEGLRDQELLVLLNGFKWLARIRGYNELLFPTIVSSPYHCTVECRIKWIPCEDNDYQTDISSGIGDATPDNTTSFTKFYLGPMAENRSFVRCVRNYLNISILGKEEIGDIKKEQKSSQSESQGLVEKLQNLMLEKKISFENIKAKLISEGLTEASVFTELKQIPTVRVFDLITRLKNVKCV